MNAPPNYEVREIAAADTIALRHRVLRPHQTPDQCHYPGDDAKSSYHIGAVDSDNRVIGIATVLKCDEDRFQQFDLPQQVRLRGMAVSPELQGQGIGRSILDACLDTAQQNGEDIFWCNARVIAIDFYRRAGFEVLNDQPFEIQGIGSHHVMYKKF